jgi:hypothetical protein
MSLAAGGAPVAVKHRAMNQSTKVRPSLYLYKKQYCLKDEVDVLGDFAENYSFIAQDATKEFNSSN